MVAEASHGLVVIAEDEATISDLLSLYLRRDGFAVQVATDGVTALELIKNKRPCLVLLDVGLPVLDGTQVCRIMRAERDWTPVIFCTARDDEIDRIVGLELGADDYITKPFSPREVVARIKAVLRRTTVVGKGQGKLAVGPVEVDRESRFCLVAGAQVQLTATEFDLLVHLLARPGKVFSREELLTQVWGYSNVIESRTVDVHVAQLRAKLGAANIIRTVRGIGYAVDDRMFEAGVAE